MCHPRRCYEISPVPFLLRRHVARCGNHRRCDIAPLDTGRRQGLVRDFLHELLLPTMDLSWMNTLLLSNLHHTAIDVVCLQRNLKLGGLVLLCSSSHGENPSVSHSNAVLMRCPLFGVHHTPPVPAPPGSAPAARRSRAVHSEPRRGFYPNHQKPLPRDTTICCSLSFPSFTVSAFIISRILPRGVAGRTERDAVTRSSRGLIAARSRPGKAGSQTSRLTSNRRPRLSPARKQVRL